MVYVIALLHKLAQT